jgi:hypothetical protein
MQVNNDVLVVQIDWTGLIVNGIFKDYPELNVKETEPILVLDVEYFKKFIEIFTDAVTNKKK